MYFYKRMLCGGRGMVGVAEWSENRYRSQDMLYGCLYTYTSDARNRAPV